MRFRREMKAGLREDRAWSDLTTRLFVPRGLSAVAHVVAKEGGVVAGAEAALETFAVRDSRCRGRVLVRDGRPVKKGRRVLEVRGPLSSLLSAERTALNVITHLSGIATLTRKFVNAAGPRGPRIMDTRKTLPGLRNLQKWAVRCGGGFNHRGHLAEAVLIKENHLIPIFDEKGLRDLYRKIQLLHRRGHAVEMECRNQKEALWGLLGGADILLLDNFSPRRLGKAVRWIKRFCAERKIRRPLLEVSGGVGLANIRSLARAGVDRISIGQLTHSAPVLDMSMDIKLL